jgi:hypothetical protein
MTFSSPSTFAPALLSSAEIHDLFRYFHEIEKELWSRYKIKDPGSYAEHLVAKALGASLLRNSVNKGFDLKHESYGRIEVRSRRYPLDGRREDRVELPNVKSGLFDFFVHVVFDPDFSVFGAYLVPHDAITALASASKNRRVRFSEGCALSDATDITFKVRKARNLHG